MTRKSKGKKSGNHVSEARQSVIKPPRDIAIKIPQPFTIRQESTAYENEQYRQACEHQDNVIKTAQRLNKITIGGAVLSVVGLVFIALSYRQSVKSLRVEQRAWISVASSGQNEIPLTLGVVPSGQMNITNFGKTPALRIKVDSAVEVVTNGSQPNYESPQASMQFATGAIFPTHVSEMDFRRTRISNNGKGAEDFPFTQSEINSLATGQSWIAIFGVANYTDIFGVRHWTKFCERHFYVRDGFYKAISCSLQNQTDSE